MKITIENTTKIVKLDDVPARVWEGETDSGVKVICFITRIAVADDEDHEQFRRELLEQRTPTLRLLRQTKRFSVRLSGWENKARKTDHLRPLALCQMPSARRLE